MPIFRNGCGNVQIYIIQSIGICIYFWETVIFFFWSKKFHVKLLKYLLNEQTYHISSNKHHRHLFNFEDLILLPRLLEDRV